MPERLEGSSALSVTDALGIAKRQLEDITVRIVGEVSELSANSRYKAVYFTIKDEKSSLPCMMWNNRYASLGFQIQVGALVELVGRFTLYAVKGRMNFDVFSMELAGEGRLRMKVANLAKKLQAEGLMDPRAKKQIPAHPEKIGLVTSPRGAAVYDVLRTLRRRYPVARVAFAGVGVEGTKAPSDMIAALKAVEDAGAEVVLLVRGGGSFEDLMPFNDEALVRTIAAMDVPVVTGIGHEPDTSIADMVADFRASTPTAAAEAVAPSASEVSASLQTRLSRMASMVESRLRSTTAKLDRIAMLPIFTEPMRLFEGEAQHIDDLHARLFQEGKTMLEPYSRKMGVMAASLDALSPLAVLSRGYSIARTGGGDVIRSVDDANVGEDIGLQVSDGSLQCKVLGAMHMQAKTEVSND